MPLLQGVASLKRLVALEQRSRAVAPASSRQLVESAPGIKFVGSGWGGRVSLARKAGVRSEGQVGFGSGVAGGG